tara:strand:+ start:294 stop:686 length:393 start_codon:yes stop_codon:yes gene_type:complete
MNKNLTYTLNEKLNENKKQIDYETLKTEIMNTETKENNTDEESMQEYILLSYEYEEYLKKDLDKIAEYYDIPRKIENSRKKKRKDELIQDIILFELDEFNSELVNRRKLLWFYLEEIKNDNYLRKFLILD